MRSAGFGPDARAGGPTWTRRLPYHRVMIRAAVRADGGGRPPTRPTIRQLVLRMAADNPG
jgi:hypothetical protein